MDVCRNCGVALAKGLNWYRSFAEAKWPNRLCKRCADTKTCADYHPAYIRRHPDRLKASNAKGHRRRYADPVYREACAARRKAWVKANAERVRESKRAYREANREKILEYQRQYRLRKKAEKENND